MNDNLLWRIKTKLNAKFYVMNDSWLRECLDFFIRDKAPHKMTDKHILEFVESQWQLSDLREISNENGCLPRNLVQQVRTVLTGTYILQVDKMYDIASSKYKQLCQIQKVNCDNLEITENEKSTEWIPKGRRMMQWYLTDGVQDITAIEYTSLKQSTLLPGYKVMIIGPADCRRGIILLEKDKYREIGGEVESMLKPNALENVLCRALNEPENPDPYNDNGILKNQNNQDILNLTNEDSFFDDDFEEAVDLEAVTAIEEQSQEVVRTVQNSANIRDQGQNIQTVRNDIAEEFLEDIDFQPLEDWPNEDSPMRPLRVLPSSRVTEDFEEEEDFEVIEETLISARNSRSKPSFSPKSCKKKDIADFPDDDFDFNDCKMMVKTESQVTYQQQSGNPSCVRSEIGMCSTPRMSKIKLMSNDTTRKIEECTSVKVSATRNDKSMASNLKRQFVAVPGTSKPKTISDSSAPGPSPKICDVLSDVLSENITGTMYRTVRAHVKSHSALTKQGKCWTVTAQITDHTSIVEVCFDSKILEEFLGFTVQEFSQRKKLAKSDSQVNNELRLSLRKAQHQIANLDALLKLKLSKGQMPTVVEIMQQKEFMKRPS